MTCKLNYIFLLVVAATVCIVEGRQAPLKDDAYMYVDHQHTSMQEFSSITMQIQVQHHGAPRPTSSRHNFQRGSNKCGRRLW